MPKYPPLNIKSTSPTSSKYLLRTILNPKNIIGNLNEVAKTNTYKSLLLLATKNYCTNDFLKKILEFQKDKNIQLVFAAIDSIAPYTNRFGVSQVWSSRNIQIENSQTLKKFKETQNEKFKNNEISKNGRIISKNLDLNHSNLHNNYFNLNANFINSRFANRHTSSLINYDLKFKIANTLFNNNNMQTCFYLLSENQKSILNKADPKQFPGLKKLLDNNNNLLNNIDISLPPIQFNSRLTVDKYDGLTDIDSEFLKISQIKGNLIFKIDDRPASSILQDNPKLMPLMDKTSRIFAIVKNAKGEERKFEIIAGGGSYGSKRDILAIDPSSVNFLEQTDSYGNNDFYIKFYLYKLKNPEVVIEERKSIFSNNGGLYFEKATPEERFIEDDGQEQIHEDIIGVGTEGKVFFNNCLLNEGEVVGLNTNIQRKVHA